MFYLETSIRILWEATNDITILFYSKKKKSLKKYFFFNVNKLLISNSPTVSKPNLFTIYSLHMVTTEADH